MRWRGRQGSSHSQDSSTEYSVREEQLAEKEVKLSELETLVREAEARAEESRKERELSEWERNIEQRKEELLKRLHDAETNQRLADSETTNQRQSSDTGSVSSPRSIQSPEPVVRPHLYNNLGPLQSSPLPGHSSLQIFGAPRPPIVLPSSTKLPPSAIKLSSSTLALLNVPGPSSSYPSSDDKPMNLCKPRASITSETSEDSSTLPHNLSTSSAEIPPLSEPIQLPIEVPKNVVHVAPHVVHAADVDQGKLLVKVIEDGRGQSEASIEAGDAVKITYPNTDDDQTFVLGDEIVLEEYLQSSGSASGVTFVAEEGPDGQITLIPQPESNNDQTVETGGDMQQLETDFENLRRNMEELSSPGEPNTTDSQDQETNENCDVNYFENRVKHFEQEISAGEVDKVAEEPEAGASQSNHNPTKSRKRKISEAAETSENLKKKIIYNEPGRRSSRLKSDNIEETENDDDTAQDTLPDKLSEKKTVKDSWQCGRCSSCLQSERSWRRHRDTVHGGSARLRDDDQGQEFSVDEEEAAWRHALKSYKKIYCPRCNKTNIVKPSSMLDHLKDCNQHCNKKKDKKILSTDKENNVKQVTQSKISKEMTVKDDAAEDSSKNGRNRRRAATKARSTVAAFVEAMKTKFEGESSDNDHDTIEEVAEDSDDNFNVNNEIVLSNFYKQIKVGRKSSYQCSVCNLSMKKKTDIENHIINSHRDKLSEGTSQGSFCKFLIISFVDDDDAELDESEESCESSSELDDDEDTDSEYGGNRNKRKKSEPASSSQRKLILEPCVEAVHLERKFRNSCNIKDRPSSLLSTNTSWKKVQIDPDLSCNSVKFSVNNLTDSGSSPSTKQSLGVMQGCVENNSSVLFTGGSVNSMAWCNNTNISKQVLAVATKQDFSSTQLVDSSSSCSSVQFWSISSSEAPVFEFGLRARFGHIWCVEWSSADVDDGLGLLAASCGDGTVRVWSVPALEQLDPGQWYSGDPVLTLTTGDSDVGQCLSLSWYRGPSRDQYLAACHVSGVVSVWHLTTKSPLLRSDDSTVLPVQTWLAHHGSVSSLSLCPGVEPEPRYLVTGGSDRCYRFWDLRDTSVPVQEHKKGLVSGVEWVGGWSGAGVTYDDVYLQSHTQSLLAETGYFATRSQPIISQNSCVTSLSVSQWLGVMAVTSSAGELIMFVMPALDRSLEHDKNLAQRRCYVYRTETVSDSDQDMRDYNTAADHSTLVYHDSGLHLASKIQCPGDEVRRVRCSDNMDTEDLTSYPLSALTSVAWNNNPGHHTLLASAGHAGLVRVHNIAALNTPSIKQVLPLK